ncbi:MAG: hypothetical protein AAF349_02550 [Cyanobacteria bacterium P01_A01_bin.68]
MQRTLHLIHMNKNGQVKNHEDVDNHGNIDNCLLLPTFKEGMQRTLHKLVFLFNSQHRCDRGKGHITV